MSHNSAAQTISTQRGSDEAIEIIVSLLQARGMTPIVDGTRVLATLGSVYVTFLLRAATPARFLPVEVVIDTGRYHAVDILVTDTYPVPPRFLLDRTLSRRVEGLAYDLRLALQQKLA